MKKSWVIRSKKVKVSNIVAVLGLLSRNRIMERDSRVKNGIETRRNIKAFMSDTSKSIGSYSLLL